MNNVFLQRMHDNYFQWSIPFCVFFFSHFCLLSNLFSLLLHIFHWCACIQKRLTRKFQISTLFNRTNRKKKCISHFFFCSWTHHISFLFLHFLFFFFLKKITVNFLLFHKKIRTSFFSSISFFFLFLFVWVYLFSNSLKSISVDTLKRDIQPVHIKMKFIELFFSLPFLWIYLSFTRKLFVLQME